MIVIKNIEFLEVDRDFWEIHHYERDHILVRENGAEAMAPVEVIRELIQGYRFMRPDGTEIYVGMSRQVADVIGIQYESWDNMQRELADSESRADRYADECDMLTDLVCDLVEANRRRLINRVKWYFTPPTLAARF